MTSIFVLILLCTLNLNTQKSGEKLFSLYCMACHAGGNNLIIPEKNLKKETLENLGINNSDSLIYQIRNGKNGMPAFGGRLKEKEIEAITWFLLEGKQFKE
jgi:cytochrome c6